MQPASNNELKPELTATRGKENVRFLSLSLVSCQPTQAGLTAARARGRKGGRPKALEPAKRQLAIALYDQRQHTIEEICRMMGISKPTLYSYIAEARGTS